MFLPGHIVSNETREKIRLAKLGQKYSAEHRKNISISLKGKHCSPNTEFTQGNVPGNAGKKYKLQLSEDGRRLWSDRQKGEKNANWNGGTSSESVRIRGGLDYRLWLKDVFTRDNWTCQKCKQRGKKLHAHHIQNFNEFPQLRFDITNGITFCKDCHILFHKIYHRFKNNNIQLMEFINEPVQQTATG